MKWETVDWERMERVWVPALLSNKYRQAHQRLQNPSGAMCCVGVLHDVVTNGQWRPTAKHNTDELATPSGSTHFLNREDEAFDVFGSDKETAEELQFFFGALNDIGRLTFREIAAMILVLKAKRSDPQTQSIVEDYRRLDTLTVNLREAYFQSLMFRDLLSQGLDRLERYEILQSTKEEKSEQVLVNA